MRRVIVNSTPLIVLSNINKLDLLKQLYGQIFIPQAVYNEVTAKSDSACLQIKDNLDWINICEIKNIEEKKMYQAKLHSGEVEVMILAQETPIADLVIIDDNAAKKTAKYLGLTITGTLGILLKAKQEGLLNNVSSCIDELLKIGFYISDEIIAMVKEISKEN